MAEIEPKLHAYAVELNSRTFLPLALEAKNAASELFPDAGADGGEHALRTLYMQFLDHPTDAQRAQLKAAGVDLLSYMTSYTWTASGTADALLDAAQLPFVRALSRIDPRDKLHAQVYAQQTPGYAQTQDGSAILTVLAFPGTSLDALKSEWAAAPDLAALVALPGQPSAIGPRYTVISNASLAEHIAAAPHVAFIEYHTPPAAMRDSTTDSSSNISFVRDFGPRLDGTGVTVAVREIGKPESHVDFISRLTFVDNDGDTTTDGVFQHATAVVGQIASDGVVQPSAKGVAPNVNILVYSLKDGDFLTADIQDAATRGARISNHSYGPTVTSWGDYQTTSADWDSVIRANNLIVFFAGNEESDAAVYNHIDFFVGMKNGLCIEASSAQAQAANPFVNPPISQSDGSAFFAKYGPMNDGRVKPDLVAFGDNVTLDTGTNGITQNTGTSFSTPASTGVATLAFQHYKTVLGAEPSAALMKALLCETASDLGAPGPDSIYGFGIVNAAAAVELIDLRKDINTTPFVEGNLNNGDSQTFTISVPPNVPFLKTTFCWMDPGGNPASAKALVNDLDMLLTDPNGTSYFPYSLNAASAASPATNTGPNTVDPIEQTIVTNPVAGVWTVKLSGTSVPSGPQSYAFCTNIVLSSEKLSAFFQASPTSGTAPLDVFFTAAGSTGNIVSYTWDFGDGSVASGEFVSHTYNSPVPPATGDYVATLLVVDANGQDASYSVTISVSKPLYTVFASQASGTVDLSSITRDKLQMTLIAPNFVLTPQQARDAVRNGVYEGKKFDVRVGLVDPGTNTASFTDLYTFLVDRTVSDMETNQSFKINLQHGTLSTVLKTNVYPPVRNMASVFQNLGITQSVAVPYVFTMRAQVETDDAIYQSDYKLSYSGKNGKGTVRLVK